MFFLFIYVLNSTIGGSKCSNTFPNILCEPVNIYANRRCGFDDTSWHLKNHYALKTAYYLHVTTGSTKNWFLSVLLQHISTLLYVTYGCRKWDTSIKYPSNWLHTYFDVTPQCLENVTPNFIKRGNALLSSFIFLTLDVSRKFFVNKGMFMSNK